MYSRECIIECIRFIFKIYNKATSRQAVLFLSLMRGEGRESKTVVNIYVNFLSLPFSNIFTRQRITLVKINGAELKLKGRTMNIKYLLLPSIFQEKPKYF